jgi:Domain of unknown function (DUF4189)
MNRFSKATLASVFLSVMASANAAYAQHAAVAAHDNANGVWAVTHVRTAEEASKIVLEHCSELMGDGCTVSTTAHNAYVTIVRDNMGAYYSDWGATPKIALQKMMARCTAAALNCKAFKNFSSKPGVVSKGALAGKAYNLYLPEIVNIEDINNLYGAAAWMEKGNDSVAGGTVWISGGYDRAEKAEKVAIDACEAASKAKCVVSVSGANVLIGVGRSEKNNLVTAIGQTTTDVDKTIAAQCRAQKQKCKRVGVFDLKKPGIQTIQARPAK